MKQHIIDRVSALRTYMKANGLHAFIFPSTDPHCGEYIPDHWKTREWISGFNGSAGTAVVTLEKAALWTDSRYFIAAEEQLSGTPFVLMKDRLPSTPSITQWLTKELKENCVVGVDAWTYPTNEVFRLKEELGKAYITIRTDLNPAAQLWEDRPDIPKNEVEIQPMKYAGRSATEKLTDIRSAMQEKNCDGMMVAALDEIAWTLNLRGTDIHCNPLFVSYLFITINDCTLYINKEKITPSVEQHLKENHVNISSYEDVVHGLENYEGKGILMDCNNVNYKLYNSVNKGCWIEDCPSPIALMRIVKNDTEIEGYRRSMLRDGIAMVKFLKWLKPAVIAGGQTEISIDKKLTSFRAEQENYRDISFDTIAGYGEHGAIVHYEATPETDIELKPKRLLLLDSGAQYQDGTTDITRTIALGPVSDEEKHDYTLVLKGHIHLARIKFPEGSSGTQLDVCARYAMWQEGINYLHGTGHGVGSYLCVHEGPHQLRMNYMPTPLRANMTLTNEPGIYKTGKHGIRIENTQLIIPYMDGEFGRFLQFEPLTLCPIDTAPIDSDMLNKEEKQWLNDYHKMVYDTLAPYLDYDHRQWLAEATQPVL
ncbi:MAG: aminopeptidase P family protein [Paraprevotella sp.]|nr:aminopeptidase P family protein [Paraprevotella sp.]